MPLEVTLRIWDLFFRDGESALLSAALAIMQMYEKKLLASDFDQLASFLTGPLPASMSPNALVSCVLFAQVMLLSREVIFSWILGQLHAFAGIEKVRHSKGDE